MGNRNFLGNFLIILIFIGIIFMIRSCFLENLEDVREQKEKEERLEKIVKEQYLKNPNYEFDEYEMENEFRKDLEKEEDDYRKKWDDQYDHYY